MKKTVKTRKALKVACNTPEQEETYNAECLLAKVIAKLAFDAQQDDDSPEDGVANDESIKKAGRLKK